MLIDYRNSSTPADVDVELCIIGAGAAGLAIACAFLGTRTTVCVVESGGLAGEESAQSLYEGSSIGAVPFDPSISRMRVFGGSCNLWGGGCIPLGELHPREWVPASGWPIGYDELQPHYANAREFCGIASQEFVQDSFLTQPRRQPIEFDPGKVVNKIFARSPVLFGRTYGPRLGQAPNITVLLHANLLELEAVPTGEAVRQARIGSLDGRRGTVRARHYVLACGGIENARLLLLSDSVVPRGLGNRHDLVGRYFMDHPSGKLGVIHTDDPGRLSRPYDRDIGADATSFPEICLSDDAQRTHRILSGRVRPFAIEGPVPKGIRALRELKSTLQARHIDEDGRLASRLSARKNGEPASGVRISAAGKDGLARQALRVGLGIGDIARGAARKLAHKPTVDPDHVALVGYFEQVPNPDSRVTLGEGRDALGQRKVCVDWRLTPLDCRTYRTAAQLFGNELARACNGRFQPEPWVERDDDTVPPVYGTSHHLGTTRMADTPDKGVVDHECRVHGIDNLYVAGSSVFPTGGWAFPTFTIVALSLRLAEHLRSRLELAALVTPFIV